MTGRIRWYARHSGMMRGQGKGCLSPALPEKLRKDGDIPLHYIMQCYHYMAVTGKRAWYIAAVILGQKFVYHKLEWDDALIDGLITMEKDFWENHVEAGMIPEPDGSDICDEILQKYFHTAGKGSAIELTGFDEFC